MDADLACPKTGKRIAARMAMIAMTTRSSIKVKARSALFREGILDFVLSKGFDAVRNSVDADKGPAH